PPANAIATNQGGGDGGGAAALPSGPAASNGGGGGGGSTQSSQPRPAPSPTVGSGTSDQSQPQASQPGMTDVALQSDIHQSNSGTFTSKGKNVRLPDGTQMQIAVAVIPPNTQIK
ncbi:MAG TPA: hypothetical protein VHT24_16670, partial [Pseudacidobacterium sp.]|nr:hypothetical protein [Pseudacidobacterium sp.]